MAVAVTTFGDHKGARVDQFRLSSDAGVEVDILNYGVVVRDWRVPAAGGTRSVVLGFDTFDPYPRHSPHFGTIAGRVANRIGGASFSIGDKLYTLPANDGPNFLHGGEEGLGKLVWRGEADSLRNAARFTHTSADGHMGFPGTVEFTATYTLSGHTLRLDLAATTDAVTPISLVQHQYFNLGDGPDVLDHEYELRVSAYTEVDDELIPTGVIRPVAGTQYDLRRPRTLRDGAGKPVSYDTNLVLDTGRDPADPVVTVSAPDRSLTLRLWSDRPGIQFYNGVYTDIPVPGLGGKSYKQFSGFCIEDQAFPDAVHHSHFPSIWCGPGKPYSHWCEIEIK